MNILQNFLIFILGLNFYKYETEQDLTEQLKAVLPNLINAKELLGNAEKKH